MPAIRVDAAALLGSELTLRGAGLLALSLALLTSATPGRYALLLGAVLIAWRGLYHVHRTIAGRRLLIEHAIGPCAGHRLDQRAPAGLEQFPAQGAGQAGRWSWGETPFFPGGGQENLSLVSPPRLCLGVVLLHLAGESVEYRLTLCLAFLDRESQRGLRLACRKVPAVSGS